MDKTTVERYFNENTNFWISNSYEKLPHTYPTALERLKKAVALIALHCPKKIEKIADLGSGGGHLSVELASRGYDVTGVDLSEKMIQQSTALAAERLNHDAAKKLRYVKGSVTETGLPAASFDLITSLGVIGYLPAENPLFKEAHRLLKPGGRFIVSCRNRLFNMSSIGKYASKEIESGEAKALVEEILELGREPIAAADAKKFLEGLQQASSELLSQPLTHASVKNEKSPELTFSVEPRQQTPKQIKQIAESEGFTHEAYLGVHPHLMIASLNKLMPAYVFNSLSESLDAFSHHPASLIWSSVFMGVFRRL